MYKVAIPFCCLFLFACGTQPVTPSVAHIRETSSPAGSIPETVQQSVALRPPKAAPKVETYSVTVYKVPAQSLLFALARDAKLNVDIHPGIEGEVTLNALNQTLPQLLTRISRQIDMRYELEGPNLAVMPDTPFLRNYKIDYVNVARKTSAKVSIATQITTGDGGGSESGNNNSTASVSSTSDHQFWITLIQNIKDTLRETDKILPESTSEAAGQTGTGATPGTQSGAAANPPAGTAGKTGASTSPVVQGGTVQNAATGAPNAAGTIARKITFREAASVIANPETGLIAVRATARQHEKIQEFLDLLMSSAKRQVLIEAMVIEVQLGDQYQQGINWSSLRASNSTKGVNVTQGQVGASALPSGVSPGATPGVFVLNYINQTRFANLAATIQLLETFGKVKVLSSPKISVLNNQTALLKVVDNRVYFTITADTTAATATSGAVTTYTSTLHTVPVGFVMSVTPQIADSDEVTINVRPSISRIIDYVSDPSPALANAIVPVVSRVPVIQTREMESVLKVSSGQIAVMGGLMQDSIQNVKDAVPGVSKIPVLGDAFAYRNETASKSELVIFMRPIVVKNASINGDYQGYRHFLRNDSPLNESPYGEPTPVTGIAPEVGGVQ